MNQPNYLNWPHYDDELANKAYVDQVINNIDVNSIRRELNTLSTTVSSQGSSINNLSNTKLDNSVFNNFITTQYNPLAHNVDAKIESFYQNTDPSITWSTLLEKSTHKGDIWYDTSSQRTYVYYEDTSTSPTSYYWQWQNVPTSLINSVNSKGTIFVGNTIPSDPSEGDLWFKSTAEGIYTYVNNAWIEYNKYTDDTTANTALGIANTASDDVNTLADEVHNDYVTTQTFNNTTGTLSTLVGTINDNYVSTTTLNQSNDTLNIAITEAKNTATSAQDDFVTLNTILNSYFNFALDGLTISVGNSSYKLKVENDRINIYKDEDIVSRWKQNEFAITKLYLTSEIKSDNTQQTGFAFIPRSDGSLSLRKISQ